MVLLIVVCFVFVVVCGGGIGGVFFVGVVCGFFVWFD